MSASWRIFCKDLRRLRGWILLWLATAAWRLFLGLLPPEQLTVLGIDGSSERSILSPFWLGPLIVGVLVLSDRPSGSRAFWMTRPISSGTLLSSKALFLGLAMATPLLVAEACVLADYGLSGRDQLLGLAEAALMLLFLLAASWAWAVLSGKLSFFLAGGLVLWGTLPLLFFGIYGVAASRRGAESICEGVEAFWPFEAYLLSLPILLGLLGSMVVVFQYLGRHRGRSALVAVAGIAAICWATWNWRWQGLEACPSGGSAHAAELVFVPSDVPARRDHWVKGWPEDSVFLFAPIEVRATPPEGFLLLCPAEGRLELEDGGGLQSSSRGVSRLSSQVAAREEGLGASVLDAEEERTFLTEILSAPRERYARDSALPGLLRLRLAVQAYEFRSQIEAPLNSSDPVARSGSRLAIKSVGLTGRRITIRFLEDDLQLRLRQQGEAGEYYLVNRQLGEAVSTHVSVEDLTKILKQVQDYEEGNAGEPGGRLGVRVSVGPKHRRDVRTETFVLPLSIAEPEAWLKDARLVRLGRCCVGRAVQSLEVENFRMVDYAEPTLRAQLEPE
ncbi:MAG: hypothetical protein KDD47_13055 [Acidobacteria bacterium]|nr:hypothetical protein [Acidobacteriota bacterium]